VPRLELFADLIEDRVAVLEAREPGRCSDVRCVELRHRAYGEHMADTEVAEEPPDLIVIRGSVVTELSHFAEDRDRLAAGGPLDERLERSPHGDRVRVPRVVDEETAARQLALLRAPS